MERKAKDRLPELKEIRKKFKLSVSDEIVSVQLEDEPNGELLLLLDKIGPLYTRIKALNFNIKGLRKGLNDFNQREKLEAEISDVKTEARTIYNRIKDVSDFTVNDSALLSHVARTHHVALVTFFSVANTELSSLQADLRDKHKHYVEKELSITGQTVTDEELENLIDRPTAIFNQNLLQDTQAAKRLLLDVQQRHDDVVKIEKSIIEVNELFMDLAVLTKEQGEMVDRIEMYVFEAHAHVEKGGTQLKEAKVSQTKARKKKIIIGVIVGVIVVVFVLIIVFSFV